MAKIKFFYSRDFKKGIIKLHTLLNEYEEKLLKINSVEDINELIDEYGEKLNHAYKKYTNEIVNFPYDENCDQYLMNLADEIEEACFNYLNFDENDEGNNNSIYRYAYNFVNLIKAREKRISLMNDFFSFLKTNNIDIEKDELYKEIDLRNSKIIKFLELNQDDAVCTKNEIIVNNLLHDKFKNPDLFLSSTLISKPSEILNKGLILEMINEIIEEYEKYGLSFSDDYRNIDFETNLKNENYYIYRISFFEPRLKNLSTYLAEYEDFVFVKNKFNQRIYLFYTVVSKLTGSRTTIYQNPITGNLFSVNVNLNKKLFDKFPFLNKYNIKNEDSIYKIDNLSNEEKEKSYKTMEYVEKYISTPLFNKNINKDNIKSDLIYLGTFKNASFIYTQILENIKKGEYNSTIYTNIDEDIENIIEFLSVNEDFSKIFDKYTHELDLVYFADRMKEIEYVFEEILKEKININNEYIEKINLPLPICLCCFKESLNLLLSSLEKQKRKISKNFLNNLYTTLKKDKKLYSKLLELNNYLSMFSLDGLNELLNINDELDDLEEENPIYKA
jgi:hypothetical protein